MFCEIIDYGKYMKHVNDFTYAIKVILLNRHAKDGVKVLPCISFCAFDSFKYTGIYFNEESYLNCTYELNDIFDDEMVVSLSNNSEYYMVESKTLMAGRCYTACHQVLVS